MARSSPADAIGEVVRLAIAPELLPLGFKKTGPNFRRAQAGCVQVLNVQSSRRNGPWGDQVGARFTINLGVYFPAAQELARDLWTWTPGPAGPAEPECHVRSRIGRLLERPGDRWWSAAPGPAGDLVVEEVRAAVRSAALPWLERMATPAAARDEAQGVAAVLLSLLAGDRAAATATAQEISATLPDATALLAWFRSAGLLT